MEYDQIKKIINDMSESSLNSLNIEFPDGVKINITKDNNVAKNTVLSESNTKKAIVQLEASSNDDQDLNIVKSPMVGTLYLKPSPDEKEFVKVGDKVKKGQVLCIIEAMKLMNEIESEYDGEIIEICQTNEAIVEYGKPLFKIK